MKGFEKQEKLFVLNSKNRKIENIREPKKSENRKIETGKRKPNNQRQAFRNLPHSEFKTLQLHLGRPAHRKVALKARGQHEAQKQPASGRLHNPALRGCKGIQKPVFCRKRYPSTFSQVQCVLEAKTQLQNDAPIARRRVAVAAETAAKAAASEAAETARR